VGMRDDKGVQKRSVHKRCKRLKRCVGPESVFERGNKLASLEIKRDCVQGY